MIVLAGIFYQYLCVSTFGRQLLRTDEWEVGFSSFASSAENSAVGYDNNSGLIWFIGGLNKMKMTFDVNRWQDSDAFGSHGAIANTWLDIGSQPYQFTHHPYSFSQVDDVIYICRKFLNPDLC
eukprot:749854_1